jgi:trehalose/maltose hydrolase-like predicted phosphorylase
MTDSIHAVIAARLGRGDEALARFRAGYQPFVRPPFHGFSEKRTKDNLCFVTGAAGVVQSVLYGFAGLHLQPDADHPERPLLEPRLPASWSRVRLGGLHWRGRRWDVELRPGAEPDWTPVQ